ncbi:MAG: hypothetical protein HOC71_08235 [Candidatus Latescibacteria bacterium]|jgi:molybdopterin/thiamine biosynthesis adenylyltransferase|nr:hypothetical protein [Candidatus Latescibacterota bacterium]
MLNIIIIPDNLYKKLSTTTEDEGFLVGSGIMSSSGKTWIIADISKTGNGAIGKWCVSGDTDPDYPISMVLTESRDIQDIQVTEPANNSSVMRIVIEQDQYRERLKVPGFKGINDFSALIIGVGSVGSRIAVDLARAGIGKLILIDPDIVEEKNLCRCEYFADQIGMNKVHALPDTIHRINPAVEVEGISWNILNTTPKMMESLISSVDIGFHATDSLPAGYMLNREAYDKLPVVYTGLYHNAFSGFVIYTLPGVTPCYECIMPAPGDIRNDNQEAAVREIPDWDYTDNTGRTRAIPGLFVDISRASTIASRIGISLLCQENEKGNFPLHNDRNAVFFCTVPEEDGVFSFPFQTEWAVTSLRDDCWCQKNDPTEDEIRSVESIIEKIPMEDGTE